MRMPAVLVALVVLLIAVPAVAADRVVDDAGIPCVSGVPLHTTISAAVAAASPGETILVCAGTYADAVTVDKPNLKLQGQGNVRLVAPAPGVHGFDVAAAGVTIQGFDISGFFPPPGPPSDVCGVRVRTAAGAADVHDNHVHGNYLGICAAGVDSRIRYNVIEDNFVAVSLDGGGGEISNNTISLSPFQTSTGIRVTGPGCPPVTIHHNLVTAPAIPLFPTGIVVDGCAAVVASNTVRGDRKVGPIAGGLLGIGLVKANGTVVSYNQVQYASVGLTISDTPNATASFNSISFNGTGISVVTSGGVVVTRNNVSRSVLIDCLWDHVGADALVNNNCGTQQPPGAFD